MNFGVAPNGGAEVQEGTSSFSACQMRANTVSQILSLELCVWLLC